MESGLSSVGDPKVRVWPGGIQLFSIFIQFWVSPYQPKPLDCQGYNRKIWKNAQKFQNLHKENRIWFIFCSYLINSNAGGWSLWIVEAAKSVLYGTVLLNRLNIFSLLSIPCYQSLTLTRPIGLPPLAPVAQKIADQPSLIANSARNRPFFI